MFSRIASILRALLGRQRFEDGLSQELEFHIQQYTEDLVAAGMPPAEAARRARVEFGDLVNVKADCREARGLRLIDELRQDVRYAVRLLRKTPGFTTTALATLAICLGANLAIFALVNSVLLRPLPFPDSDRLVRVFNTYPRAGVPDDGATVTNYYERSDHVPPLTGIALYHEGSAIVGETGSTEREPVAFVTPEFFTTLGVGPAIGRAFTEAETTYQSDRVVIVTDGYWRQFLAADSAAIGRRVRVDGEQRTIVGILPASFSFLSSKARLYFPLASAPDQRRPDRRHSGSSSEMIARLAPGATLAQAQSAIDAHNTLVERDDPIAKMIADAGFRSLVVPLHADHVASVGPILWLVQAGAAFLLLIGIVNLVNLLLVRAGARTGELAVRQAIGATRLRVAREIIIETTVLTIAGGALGLVVGASGVPVLEAVGADRLPLGAHLAIDARLVWMSILGAVVLGIVMGASIAWSAVGRQSAAAVRLEARGTTADRASQRWRHGFIVAQIALALVLLSGSALLGVSLQKASSVAPGFRAANVLSGQISLPPARYADESARLAFIDRIVSELGRQPGVLAAGVVTNVPFSGRNIKSAATVKGYRPPPGESVHGHYGYGVGGDYFAAMGMSLIEGRFLTEEDAGRSNRVCVVDQDFARRYWPRTGAVGQRLFEGSEEKSDAEAYTIVGVVAAVKQAGLTDEAAQGAVFYPYSGRFNNDIFLVTRTTARPESIAPVMQHLVRTIDPELPVNDLQSMETRIADSLVARRSPALLASLFSAIALLLTAIGTYGVLSYAVAQRRREIGLRMALGARPQQVRAQFLAIGLRLLAAGVGLGLLGAWLTGRAMQPVLFHVPALHVATLTGAVCVIAAVSLCACLLPSHRAARITPVDAMNP